jgi:hypothetical protein
VVKCVEQPPKICKKCATPGCGRSLRARGFCTTCFYRHLRRGDFEAGSPMKRWKHRISNVDVAKRTATCTTCGPAVKVISRGQGRWRCYTDVRVRSRDYKRAYRAGKRAMMKDHCEICGTKASKGRRKVLHWDHDHHTGRFRGTLCNDCNTAIGLLKDDPQLCRSAVGVVRVELRHAIVADEARDPFLDLRTRHPRRVAVRWQVHEHVLAHPRLTAM